MNFIIYSLFELKSDQKNFFCEYVFAADLIFQKKCNILALLSAEEFEIMERIGGSITTDFSSWNSCFKCSASLLIAKQMGFWRLVVLKIEL